MKEISLLGNKRTRKEQFLKNRANADEVNDVAGKEIIAITNLFRASYLYTIQPLSGSASIYIRTYSPSRFL